MKKCELLLQEDLDVATDWQSTAGELCWILKSHGSHYIVRWFCSTMQNCDFSQVYTTGTIWVIGSKFSMFYKEYSRCHKGVMLGKIWSCLNYVGPKFNFFTFQLWLHWAIIAILQPKVLCKIRERATYSNISQQISAASNSLNFYFDIFKTQKHSTPRFWHCTENYTRYYTAALYCINILLRQHGCVRQHKGPVLTNASLSH